MVFFCVVLGIIEGYVTIKLESAIPAGMIHSLLNAGAGFAIFLSKAGYNPILGPTLAGFLGGIPFVIVAAVLLVRVGKTRKSDAESERTV